MLLSLSLVYIGAHAQPKPLGFEPFLGSETEVQQMVLSPDGDKVAYVAGNKQYGSSLIYILDLKTGKSSGVEAPFRTGFDRVAWLSANRLLGTYLGGYVAVDADGRHYTDVNSNNGRIGSLLYVFPQHDRKHHDALFQSNYFPSDKMDADDRGYSRPDVLTINVQSSRYATLIKNPGDVIRWYADKEGEVRMALELRDGKLSLLHRDRADASWQKVPGLQFAMYEKGVLGFSNDGAHAFVEEDKSIDESVLRLYDLKTGATDGEVLAVKHGSFSNLILAPDHRVIGVRFLDSRSQTFWFDESYGRIQQAMEARIPGQQISFINSSEDESKLLFFATSPQNPGTYFLLDVKQGSLAKLVDVNPDLPVDRLSKEVAINLKARDGLTLPGSLILPAGRPAKNLPLIVWAHSGPWSRGTVGYHDVGQYFANRAYAVLTVDYRGSFGYSYAYYRAGFRQIGSGMLNDLEDATAAALKSGMFDPSRVAIMGRGFGGYCAYMCAIRRPDLFKCGVTINAIVDWKEFVSNADANNPDFYYFDEEHLGDIKADAEAFAAITPLRLADQIKVPFLVAYDDLANPSRAADKKMAHAMKEAGCDVQVVDGYSDRSFYTRKGALHLYPAVADYLDAHLK